MIKKLIILIFAIAPLGAFAQELKLAYINTNELFAAMPEVKDVQTKLQAKDAENKKALDAIQTEYNTKVEEFKNSKEAPTAALTADRQKQLEQLSDRYQSFVQTSSNELKAMQDSLIAPLQKKLQDAITAVGNEQGFTYIMEVGALPFVSAKAIDASTMIKAKLGIK